MVVVMVLEVLEMGRVVQALVAMGFAVVLLALLDQVQDIKQHLELGGACLLLVVSQVADEIHEILNGVYQIQKASALLVSLVELDAMDLVVRVVWVAGIALELVVEKLVELAYRVSEVVEELEVVGEQEVLVVLEQALVSDTVSDPWALVVEAVGQVMEVLGGDLDLEVVERELRLQDTKLFLEVALDVGVLLHNQALQGSLRYPAQEVVVPPVEELVRVQSELAALGKSEWEAALDLAVALARRVVLELVLLGAVVLEMVAQEKDQDKAWVVAV